MADAAGVVAGSVAPVMAQVVDAAGTVLLAMLALAVLIWALQGIRRLFGDTDFDRWYSDWSRDQDPM